MTLLLYTERRCLVVFVAHSENGSMAVDTGDLWDLILEKACRDNKG